MSDAQGCDDDTCPYMMSSPVATSAGVPEQGLAEPHSVNCVFGRDACGKGNLGYIQPPRPQSFKPVNVYNKPTTPMESETIYQKSYYPIDAGTMQNARLAPCKQSNNIETPCGKLEDKTVMSMSYMGHTGVKRPAPIVPLGRSLLGHGVMSTETTQKHDYVPKPTVRVSPILPVSNMLRTVAPLENHTTFRLSYMPIDLYQNPPPKPIRPEDEYEKPVLPAEKDTIYKLSYLPLSPPAKEEYPWARKASHSNPFASIEKDTIYKLSYMGSGALQKSEPMYPVSCLKLFDGHPAHSTIYKSSYMPTSGERPNPFRPLPSLQRSDSPVEKDTIYKLSFMGHSNAAPPSPIVPGPSKLRSDGPMFTETTQKHDFVPKPLGRTAPFLPINNTIMSQDGLEKDTIYKLSYMAHDMGHFKRALPIRPISETQSSTAPMEHETTHSLSYMPVRLPRREPQPWAQRGAYQRSTAPVECDTIQRMSYRPPGIFSDGSGTCSCYNRQELKFQNHTFPKAGIVN